MRRLILHIGAAKCASSSLQSYLSEKFVSNDFQTSPYAGRYKYLSVFADGRVGDGLASYPFAEIAAQPLAIFEAALAQLEPGQSAIMSCEGWGPEIMQLDLAAVFARLNVALEIFCVVRPPIEWINSGWWQWGVWSGQSIADWVQQAIPNTLYADWLQAYARLPGLQRLEVVDLSQQPLARFKAFLGVDDDWDQRVNVATHPALLEHLIKFKEHYQRLPHDSSVERRLNSLLKLPSARVAMALNQEMRSSILVQTQASARRLLDSFISQDENLYTTFADRYFSDAAYRDLAVVEGNTIATDAERDDLLLNLLGNTGASFITDFCEYRYVAQNPDVARDVVRLGMNPYEHFVRFGLREGRRY